MIEANQKADEKRDPAQVQDLDLGSRLKSRKFPTGVPDMICACCSSCSRGTHFQQRHRQMPCQMPSSTIAARLFPVLLTFFCN